MCNPAVALLAITVAQTAFTYVEGNKAANRQQQAIQDGIAKDQAATRQVYEQINESAQDEQAQRHTEYLIDAARLKAIQGESGLSGASYDQANQAVENNANSDMATIEKNRMWKASNGGTQALAKANQASIQMAGIRRPSAIGAGLQIAGAGAEYKGTK